MEVKKWIKMIYTAIFFIIFSCSGNNESLKQYNFKSQKTIEVRKEESSIINDKPPYIFIYHSSDTIQTLTIKEIKKGNMNFTLKIEAKNFESILEGKAILRKENNDGESIVDDDNNLYFIEQFDYLDENYDITFRVDTENFLGTKIYAITKNNKIVLSGRFMKKK